MKDEKKIEIEEKLNNDSVFVVYTTYRFPVFAPRLGFPHFSESTKRPKRKNKYLKFISK